MPLFLPAGASAECYVVDFGSDASAADTFMATLSRLGHAAARTDGRVVIGGDVLTALFLMPHGSGDGSIVAHRGGKATGVQIGGYAYTLWPESAGPKLATRWALRKTGEYE